MATAPETTALETSAPQAPAAQATTPAPTPGAVAVPLWLGLVMAVGSFALFTVPILAPAIAAETGLAPSLVGLYSGTVWAAAILSSAFAGRLIARVGAWPLTQACLLLCAAGVTIALAGGPLALVLSAIVVGLGHGLETPASSHLLAARVPPARRPWLFSVKQSGVQVGAVVAAVVLPLLAALVGWRGAMIAVALLSIGCAALVFWPRRTWADAPVLRAPGNVGYGIATLVRGSGDLRRLAWAAAAFGATQICLNSFFVTYAVEERGDTLAQAGRWLAAGQVGGLTGRLFWGWTASRFGLATGLLRALGITMALCAAVLGGFGATLPPLLLAPVLVAFGLTANGWNGIFLAEIARLAPPAQAGAATGAAMIVMTVGLVAGPLLFSALAAAWSFGGAFIVIALIAALGTALLPRPRTRP